MNSDYNVKVLHYVTGKQVRIYDNIVKKSKKCDIKLSCDKLTNIKKHIRARSADDVKAVSVSRTINTLYEYARSNIWEYFFTLTFNPDKTDSFDYDTSVKAMSQWINNIKKKYSPDLKYIFVPEQHKSGRWHFHALVSNIGNMTLVDSGKLTDNDDIIYNIDNYKKGFTTATKIKDTKRASSYITKYLTKQTDNKIPKGRKRYWVSRNIKKAYVSEELMNEKEKYSLKNKLMDEFELTYIKNVRTEYNNVTYMEFE